MNNDIQLEKIKLAQDIMDLWYGPKNKQARESYRGSKTGIYIILSQAKRNTLLTRSVAHLKNIILELRKLHGMDDLVVGGDTKPTAQLNINASVEFSPSLGKFVLKQGANYITIESGMNTALLVQTHGGLIASPVTVSFIPAPRTFSGKFGKTWGELSLVQQRYIEELENKAGLR